MAATILIGVAILSLGVYLFTYFGNYAKDVEDDDFTEAGNYACLASAKQGTGDGSTVENSADYFAWCLDDEYSPTKVYYVSVISGGTCITFMVLVYL